MIDKPMKRPRPMRKTTVSLPKSTYDRMKAMADHEGVSLSEIVRRAIALLDPCLRRDRQIRDK